MPAELSDRDRKRLWGKSHGICAFPQCRQALTQEQLDADTGESFDVILGEEAHVRSATPGGPRFDPLYPTEMLETYENRILVCSVHHTLIDSQGGRAYDAETLLKMKRQHEQHEERLERSSVAIRQYIADRMEDDNRVRFRQVQLDGPTVDSMFVDVPFACRTSAASAPLLERIGAEHPGDVEVAGGFVATGAAQALLHPDWKGNALVVGGPGQGKSTLLQYICQFHRARFLGLDDYTGQAQGLKPATETVRIAIRIDLRRYAEWAGPKQAQTKRQGRQHNTDSSWRPLEAYLADHIHQHSGGHRFDVEDLTALVAAQPVLLALDGLDEVANLSSREQVADAIMRAYVRLRDFAFDLVTIVATRPGASGSLLWSSPDFPQFHLQKLSAGLRLLYLNRWTKVSGLSSGAASKLRKTFRRHEDSSHIRDLASYPMQLAILLHLLYRRGLLPQQRTELYSDYMQTFLDREQTEEKEPLLWSQRRLVEDVHAFLGWHLQTEAESDGSGRIARADLQRLLREHLTGRPKGHEFAEALFSAMEGRVLCLIERETGFFEFEVQSLREYFAAKYVFDYAPPKGDRNSRSDCFEALLVRPAWLNVCRFLVGMFTRTEVSGIHHSLKRLGSSGGLARHPHLRLAAGRFLDDRAYQDQPIPPIQEIVDYVLTGPGVVLADDGFLDESGQPLMFSEDAGRQQVIEHLKPRLAQPGTSDEHRQAIVRTIARHESPDDHIMQWWWSEFRPTDYWLRNAADLGLLKTLSQTQDARVAQAAANSGDDLHWACEVLAGGGYVGAVDDALSVCKREINDGAADLLGTDSSTALGKLATLALASQARPGSLARPGTRGSRRTRIRNAEKGRGILASVVEEAGENQARPSSPTDASAWTDHLEHIFGFWGDGWVIRQAVALLPARIDLTGIKPQSAVLTTVVDSERARRLNRGDIDYWRHRLADAATDLDRRAWLFSVLTVPHTQVVIELASDIDDLTQALAPRHYRSMESALHAFGFSSLAHRLALQDDLRLGRVQFSPKSLWLIRQVASDGTLDQIFRKMGSGYTELLGPGMGVRTDVLTSVSRAKTLPSGSFAGTRPGLSGVPWSNEVKLGRLSLTTASEILDHPDQWPVELVARAIQHQAALLSQMPSITHLAEADHWFQPASRP